MKCQRCGEDGNDKRTLWMSCLYDMSELDVPFALDNTGSRNFFTLVVCKDCRADWMQAIQDWFKTPKTEMFPPDLEVITPIRYLGTNRQIPTLKRRIIYS